MKVSHEAPIPYMKQIRGMIDYDYILPHLLDESPEYKQYFQESKEMGRYIIMDNSLHELGEPYDLERLDYWMNYFKPDEFIVPDYWQARYAEIEINEVYNECYPDHALFNEKNAMNGARRKRLWDDFEKDEKDKMNNLIKDFYYMFKMSRPQIKEELEEFGGTIEDFYHYCDKQFGTRQEKLQTRGRPRKII